MVCVEAERDSESGVCSLAVRIVEARLEIRERTLNGPGIGHHSVALINQALVAERLKRPDHALHKAFIHSAVGVVEADPARLPANVPLPILRVALDRAAAMI